MNLGELFIKLGVKADTQAVTKFKDSIKGIALDASISLASLTALAYGISKFTESTREAVIQMTSFNQQTGLSIDKLQKWQQSAQLGNLAITADQVTSSIQNLQNAIAQIRLGGGNVRPFQLLGLDIGRMDAFQVLEQLRNKVKSLPSPIAVNLLQQMGLSPEMLQVLKMSREEFEKISSLPILSEKQRGTINSLSMEYRKFALEFKALKDQFVAMIAPSMIQSFRHLTNIMEFLFKTASATFQGVNALFTSTDKNLIALKQGLVAIGAVVGVAFAPITTALLAILLIIDDIMTYVNDAGESYTGKIVDTFSKKENFFGTGALKTLGKGFPALGAIGNIIDQGWGAITGSGQTSSNNNANINNTYNINAKDSEDVARQVVDIQEKQLKHTMMNLNQGSAY